jgi:hypothetical protein
VIAYARAAHQDFLRLTDDLPEVKALETMSVRELAERYQEVFGEPTRSRNRMHLVRSIAWRLQEERFGGLSPETLRKLVVLGGELPRTWRRRVFGRAYDGGARPGPELEPRAPAAPEAQAEPARPEPARPEPARPRDPRLPPVGTVLRRTYRNEEHEVTVLDEWFEYRGKQYTSLSKIARLITGTPWNGVVFFGCAKVQRAAHEKGQERT